MTWARDPRSRDGGVHRALQQADRRTDTLEVKVCPHCAEEVPDQTSVCPHCHKDPGVPPDWAASGRDVTFWRSQSADNPDVVPNLVEQKLASSTDERPRGVSDFMRDRLATTSGTRTPSIVWVSYGMWAASGYAGQFGIATGAFIIMMFCVIAGVVLGVAARRQIKASEGTLGGLMGANIAIALNLFRLVTILISYGPLIRHWLTGS